MKRNGRGLTHYGLQEFSANWKKFHYKVDQFGTELLCPRSLKWVPFHKKKMIPMLLERNNNLSGVSKGEI